jgi:predicted AAA+ superfamily ATPase
MGNGQIKIITGVRRCGKSFLLFNIFCEYLKAQGISDNQIIAIALDNDMNEKYKDPKELSSFVRSRIIDESKTYYILLDEVQYAISKEELRNPDIPVKLYSVLNGLLRLKNVDIYVTGSNSKMLSRDVMTEFRGRGDVIELFPLTFREYYDFTGGEKSDAFEEYALYGGMPLVLSKKTDDEKFKYLSDLFNEVYFKDIIERYNIELPNVLSELTDDLCSSIGSLTNSKKIADTLKSVKKIKVNSETIASYLEYLTDSFLFRCAKRYDVKEKRYFEYPSKYYCVDIGLRNVRLNLRQQEETHIMENVIYNELVVRGYSVDVGVVKIEKINDKGIRSQKALEIDFVVNRGAKKYYIQSALALPDEDKTKQELRPLLSVKDCFKKIVITKTSMKPWTDDMGIVHLGLYDFLLDEDSLNMA